MNKFAKGCLIVAAVLVVIGFIVVGTAFAMGARIGDLPNMSFNIGRHGGNIFRWGNWGADIDAAGTKVDTLAEFDEEDVDSLTLGFGAVSVVMKQGDKYSVEISDNSRVDLQYSLDDGCLSIYNDEQVNIGFADRDEETVTITVPKNAKLHSFKLDLGAGKVKSTAVFSAGEAKIEVGAGKITMEGITSEYTKIDCAAGEATLSGKFTGETKIDCGMGDVELTTEGEQADYKCDAAIGMGSVIFGDRSYNGIGDVDFGRDNAKNDIDIDLAMGKVAVYFE